MLRKFSFTCGTIALTLMVVDSVWLEPTDWWKTFAAVVALNFYCAYASRDDATKAVITIKMDKED